MKRTNLNVELAWLGAACLLLTPQAAKPQTPIFSDNFDDRAIDAQKWTTTGYTVQEVNGYMRVGTDATDNGGFLLSRPVPISPSGDITILRTVSVHRANSYFAGNISIRFGELQWIAVHYADHAYTGGGAHSRHGTFISRNAGSPEGAWVNLVYESNPTNIVGPFPMLWDTWFSETVKYSPATGILEYLVNDAKLCDYFVGVMPLTNAPTIQFGFRAWGWWTGHEQLFDDFVVTQDIAAPVIFGNPTNQTANSGSACTFVVHAGGAATLHYQWRREGINLSGATNATLTVINAQASDSGGYSVVVWNAYGSVVSATAHLAVLADGANGNTPIQVKAPASPVRQPSQDSIVVVTHGMQLTSVFGHPQMPQWVTDMCNAIRARVPSNWVVTNLDWSADAYQPWPDLAVLRGVVVGDRYGVDLSSHGWQNVHLIGHSAGAAVIESIASRVRRAQPETVIHSSFLDPYLSSFLTGSAVYGANADWADCYFAQDWTGIWTSGPLANAYNVDVSWLDPNATFVTKYCYEAGSSDSTPIARVPCGQEATSSHEWAHDFYSNSIAAALPDCAAGFGFALSKEGGGWNNHGTLTPGEAPVVPCGQTPLLRNLLPSNFGAQLPINLMPNAASPAGVSFFGGGGVSLASGSGGIHLMDIGTAAWVAVGLTVTSAVNVVQFDAGFMDTNAAQGLLTVYWNTNQIGMVDERVAAPGLQTYRFALPGAVAEGLYTLSFRLDAFTNASSIIVTNVATGFVGLSQPITLAMVLPGSNSPPLLQLTAPAGYNYLLESATNLVNWTPTALLVNTNGAMLFVDPAMTNSGQRFYRALMP